MDKKEIEEVFKKSFSYDDVCKSVYGYSNGKVTSKMRSFAFNNNIDTSHFDYKVKTRKYKVIEKECPICGKKFTTKEGSLREKKTCSYACSNTHFRSGENNGCFKDVDDLTGENKYVRMCFENHKKECVVCGENNIVAVHHYDENHNNNEPTNLIPLCPTHHQYMHSRYRKLVEKKVEEYRNKFIRTWCLTGA